MADNDQGLDRPGVSPDTEETPEQRDRQTMLLRLAERTVLQAEALAREITDRAKQESEAEAVRLREQHTAVAQEESQRIIESAEQKAVNIAHAATAQSRAESQEILANAHGEANSILDKAQADGLERMEKAQVEVNDVLASAQQDAQKIIHASQTRAANIESNARLRAEFIVRQMSQGVADRIRRALMETFDNLLPSLDDIEHRVLENPEYKVRAELPDTNPMEEAQSDPLDEVEYPPDNSEDSSSAFGESTTSNGSQASDKPSGRRKARSSADPQEYASGGD